MRSSIEHIRELNPIEKIAGEYTDLKTMGKVLRAKCPLPAHQETEPSFTVYPDSQSFYCFGCRRGVASGTGLLAFLRARGISGDCHDRY